MAWIALGEARRGIGNPAGIKIVSLSGPRKRSHFQAKNMQNKVHIHSGFCASLGPGTVHLVFIQGPAGPVHPMGAYL